MTAGGGVGVVAVLDAVANSIHSPEVGMISLAHHELSEFLITRDLIAELIAADREYDEANAAYYDGCLLDRLPRLESATARRASALAALVSL